jgi:hypothetical protein
MTTTLSIWFLKVHIGKLTWESGMGGFWVTIEGQEFSVLCIGEWGVHIAEFRNV